MSKYDYKYRKKYHLAGPSFLDACSGEKKCTAEDNYKNCRCSANYPANWVWNNVISFYKKQWLLKQGTILQRE